MKEKHPEHHKKLADYAMVFELTSRLAHFTNEKEVVTEVFDFFTSLCAANTVSYLGFVNGEPQELEISSSTAINGEEMKNRLTFFRGDYQWTDSGKGFTIRIPYGEETLGVLEVDEISFPEYREHYLNLAINTINVVALAISNSRIFEELEERIKERTGELVQANASLLQEIREHEEAHKELRESEMRYRSVTESANEGIVSVDKSGKIISWNNAASDIFGYSTQTIMDKPLSLLIPEERNESGFALIARFINDDGEMRSGNFLEVVGRRQNGERFPMEISLASWWADDERYVTGIIRDISNRRRVESELNRLVRAIEHTAETILITDTEGVIIYVNPAFEKTTGYTREDAIGKTPNIIKSGKQDRAFYKKMWGAIKRGRIWSGRIVNKRKDGSLVEEHVTIYPVFDSQGKMDTYVALKRDITREVRLTRAKDYFTSVTSHELRTPLTKLGLVRLLLTKVKKRTSESSNLDDARSVLEDSIIDFDRIISAALLFSDLTLAPNRESFQYANIDLALQYCVESAKASILAENRDVKILFTGFSRGIRIKCDHEMIQKALTEVISNAIKYTPDGKSVRITGSVKGDRPVVEVLDEGIGIPTDTLEEVFEPFFSLADHKKHVTSKYLFLGVGVGMGLTIAKLIMEYHDGSLILASSGKNLGTKAIVTFQSLL